MKYKVTCLTPTLVGDGHKLSPIDYMVWKDQVNVLDQTRIFRLLSKGPRLEGYLSQLKRATKLDFASWGGFAQNFAGRRIPFEHAAYSEYWNRAQAESLSIPTFSEGASGAYLPGAAIKGALRTGLLSAAMRDNSVAEIAQRFTGERPPRRPAEQLEDQLIGTRTRFFSAADSAPVPVSAFKVYLIRTSTLQAQGGGYKLGWKQSPRGAVDGKRPEDSTPAFAEMAAPGSAFEGAWSEKHFFDAPEVRRILHWQKPVTRESVFAAANGYAEKQLAIQSQYAEWTGLPLLAAQVQSLQAKLSQARESGTCVLSIGWGAGFAGKSVMIDTASADAKNILRTQPYYERAIQSGLPFPKTRRIVFIDNQPASLPGWVELSVA